jgi:hypothetical protein
MKHFWINVCKNEKRKAFMQKQFKHLGLENYRVPAVTPEDFDECLAHKRPLTCKHPGCTSCEYEFACLSSHILALRMCLEKSGPDDKWFVILEDDVYLPFIIDYDKLISAAPPDTELIQTLILYGPTVKHLYEFRKKHNLKMIKWQYLLPSTGMYLISRKGAQKLVNMFYDKNNSKYNFSSSPYQIVADVLLYSSINSYASCIPLAYPYIKMGSEIHPDHLGAHSCAIRDIKDVIGEMVTNRDFEFVEKYVPEESYIDGL